MTCQHSVYAGTEAGAARPARSVPVVEIPADVYLRLQAIVDAAPGEVSGFGLVDVAEARLIVREIFCPPQTCSAVSTEVGAEAMADLLIDLVRRDVDVQRLRLWWHSHVDFAAYFSGVDRDTMAISFPHADWVLGLVLNRAGEAVAALEASRPVPLRLEGLPVRLHVPDAARAAAEEEIRAAVHSCDLRGTGAPEPDPPRASSPEPAIRATWR